jgi:hypothetical protein
MLPGFPRQCAIAFTLAILDRYNCSSWGILWSSRIDRDCDCNCGFIFVEGDGENADGQPAVYLRRNKSRGTFAITPVFFCSFVHISDRLERDLKIAAAGSSTVNTNHQEALAVQTPNIKYKSAGRNNDGPIVAEKLFIGNVPFTTSKDQLESEFRKFGEIKELAMPVNAQRRPSGIAFVTYTTADAANKARATMNNQTING